MDIASSLSLCDGEFHSKRCTSSFEFVCLLVHVAAIVLSSPFRYQPLVNNVRAFAGDGANEPFHLEGDISPLAIWKKPHDLHSHPYEGKDSIVSTYFVKLGPIAKGYRRQRGVQIGTSSDRLHNLRRV